jgi:C4-dicarboxylate-specific signal transduction histidine kinase
VSANEYSYLAELETDLAELSPVNCNVGDISQVLLNLIVNASYAIADATSVTGAPDAKGTTRVSTRVDGDDVLVIVADSGCGIPDDVGARTFDPFFTTKEVGRGTGQGLAISRTIVNDKQGGSLTFQTARGEGTTSSSGSLSPACTSRQGWRHDAAAATAPSCVAAQHV